MLRRRSILASSAALAAGCATADTQLSLPSARREAAINVVASTIYGYLYTPIDGGSYRDSPESKYQRAATALAEDRDDPYSPARGGYRLALRFYDDTLPRIERVPESLEEYEAAEARALKAVGELLDSLAADLVVVEPLEALRLGRNGLLLPLDRFSGAEQTELEREFYPSVLDPYREDGALYALPVGAAPLMLFYDEEFLEQQGVPPPDARWDWDDLAENAGKLTTRQADGTVERWGVVTHWHRIYWALWQNGASLVDMETLQCRAREPEAVAALQFVHDLMHKHRVSPAATFEALAYEIWDTPPAMIYSSPPLHFNQSSEFRMAALPRGKVHATPVGSAIGIGIAARTQHAEAAYAALHGFTRAMQAQAPVPTRKEAIARLAETHQSLRPAEVTAVQHALEYGRQLPRFGLPIILIDELMKNIARGDDVATVVRKACFTVDHFRETGKLSFPEE